MKAKLISYNSTRVNEGKTLHCFHMLIDNRLFIIDEIRKDDKVRRTVKAQERVMIKDEKNRLIWTGKYASTIISIEFELKDDIIRTLRKLIKKEGLKRDRYY